MRCGPRGETWGLPIWWDEAARYPHQVGGAADDVAAVRLGEVVALLSFGTDLGLGQPMEHMIRAC